MMNRNMIDLYGEDYAEEKHMSRLERQAKAWEIEEREDNKNEFVRNRRRDNEVHR